MLLLAAPPVAPLFTARFVLLGGVRQDDAYALTDAREDGTAVGTSYYRMTNSYPTRPLYIFSGRELAAEMTVPKGYVSELPYWYPAAILGTRRVIVGPGPHARGKGEKGFREATIRDGRLIVAPEIFARPFASALRVDADRFSYSGPGEEPIDIPRSFDPGRYRGRKRGITEAMPTWFPMKGGGYIGAARFSPPPRNDQDPDVIYFHQDYIGLIHRNGVTRPLREVVARGYDFRQLVWASPEGWYIFSADRGKDHGLVWLKPVRRKR